VAPPPATVAGTGEDERRERESGAKREKKERK
jgi:hypothetical protein